MTLEYNRYAPHQTSPDRAHRIAMTALAQEIDVRLNPKGEKKTSFVLMMFPHDAGPDQCEFISRWADRADAIALFKAMVTKLEANDGIVTGA